MNTLYPEYGARVKVTGLYGYPDRKATVVADDPESALVTVRLNFNGTEAVFCYEEVNVYLAPSYSAWSLTQRKSVDEVLVMMLEIADAMNPDNTTYFSALVFELIRLNTYAEALLYF